jgi:hypothetical protein
MPNVFFHENLDRTIIENPKSNPNRTIIEDPEPNLDRTMIEDPESDPDSNSSNDFATIAENHLQKNKGKLRNGPRKNTTYRSSRNKPLAKP